LCGGEDGVPAVDPVAPAHVQTGGQAQPQVHPHAQADAGDGLKGKIPIDKHEEIGDPCRNHDIPMHRQTGD